MSSETTKKQIEWIDEYLKYKRRLAHPNTIMNLDELQGFAHAKLALVRCLEMQERMEREKPSNKLDSYDEAAAYFGLPPANPDGSAGGGE